MSHRILPVKEIGRLAALALALTGLSGAAPCLAAAAEKPGEKPRPSFTAEGGVKVTFDGFVLRAMKIEFTPARAAARHDTALLRGGRVVLTDNVRIEHGGAVIQAERVELSRKNEIKAVADAVKVTEKGWILIGNVQLITPDGTVQAERMTIFPTGERPKQPRLENTERHRDQ